MRTMDNFLVVYTAKADGVDQAAVKKAALDQYTGYYVRHINETDDEFEVHLAKLADKKSSRKRQAAPPPEFLKNKKDDAPSDDEDSESPDEEADEDSGKKPDDDAESKGDDTDKTKGNPADAVKKVIDQLTSLFTELGGHIDDLQKAHDDKDQKLNEIKDVATPDGTADMPDVPPMADVPNPAEIGPTPGKTPGAPPMPPRKPPVPTGRVPGRGLPTSFTRTQIVDHPIKDDDGEYSVADVEAAVKADERFAKYVVDEVKKDSENNVWKAKLVLAEEPTE
jgi:hypothetical protein